MALIYKGIKCSICHKVIEDLHDIVATTHFIFDQNDPLWPYSDSAMHPACFSAWALRDEFVARYNDFVGSFVHGNGTCHEMQPNGDIEVKPALVVSTERGYNEGMPFSNCQQCGRLFHRFDPTLPESPVDYWPNMAQGDAVHDICPECLKSGRDLQPTPDPNAKTPQSGGEATRTGADAPADAEEAWMEWSSHIQKVDERGMALLRAAFEAGWEASRRG